MYRGYFSYSSRGHIYILELYLQSAFSAFVFLSNSIAVENGDHIGVNFLESGLLSSAVCIWNLVVVLLWRGYLLRGEGEEREIILNLPEPKTPVSCQWQCIRNQGRGRALGASELVPNFFWPTHLGVVPVSGWTVSALASLLAEVVTHLE